MGVDEPAIGPAGTGKHTSFFAPPPRRQELEELLPQRRLDLVIHICMACPAARAVRPDELCRQRTASSLGRGNHRLEQVPQVGMCCHRVRFLPLTADTVRRQSF
jgi:hypothetical protein